MVRGRKVRRDEVEGLLRKWEASGQPMSTWCERRGLNWYSLSAFKAWGAGAPIAHVDHGVVELPGAIANDRPAPGFAEVVVAGKTPEPVAHGGSRYRVEVGAFTIEVDEDFRSETLQRLVRAVATC